MWTSIPTAFYESRRETNWVIKGEAKALAALGLGCSKKGNPPAERGEKLEGSVGLNQGCCWDEQHLFHIVGNLSRQAPHKVPVLSLERLVEAQRDKFARGRRRLRISEGQGAQTPQVKERARDNP